MPKKAAETKAREAAKKAGKESPKPQTIEDYYLDWRTWQLSDRWADVGSAAGQR